MTVMKSSVIGILFLFLFSGETWAADAESTCGNPDPRLSHIWRVFETYVKDTYRPGMVYSELAYGHALGRLASAVKGDPERDQGFACVLFGLEQKYGFTTMVFGNDIIYKRMMLAAMGGRDDIVARTFHVTDTTPLTEVFTEAFRLSGRNSSGRTSSPTQTGQSQTVVKSDSAESFGLSSTAPTQDGSDKSCVTGDRWSLAEAETFLAAASSKRESVSGNCTKDNWFLCKEIEQDLLQARDHIFQVFDQNHDGIANCRLCNYDQVLAQAKKLIQWEKWLSDRYYHASGLSTIYYTIQDNHDDPLCRLDKSPVPSASPNTSSAQASNAQMSKGPMHACADPHVPADAHWKFYRYIYGGGKDAYPEKGGLICYGTNVYWTYQGSQMEKYVCEGEWENCRKSDSSPYVYTNIQAGEDGTRYEYEGGWGVRSSSSSDESKGQTNPDDSTGQQNVALLASKACSIEDLTSGREWAFGANVGVSRYYEHSGFVCSGGGGAALHIQGNKLIGYTCKAQWESCRRNTRYDAELIYPAKDYLWGKRWFSQLKMKWAGMNPRNLYIEKK